MNNLKMNRQLGTKWFTFYTKVRPWLACISAFSVIADFILYREAYTNYWWMAVYFLAALAQPVLCIMVWVKSHGDYEDFVRFVKGVLLFETINMAYGQAVQRYIQNEFNIGVAIIVGVIILLLGYFIWYRLNMKYFKKRIKVIENDFLFDGPNRVVECMSCGYRDENLFTTCPKCGKSVKRFVYLSDRSTVATDKIRFCRKCGEKIIDGDKFCGKCGEKLIDSSQVCCKAGTEIVKE